MRKLARMVVVVRDELRGRVGFTLVSLASWSAAGREVMRLRLLRWRLRHEQRELIGALGEAVYRDDDARAAALKLEARERDERIDECARGLQLALETAHARVSRERATIAPTRVLGGDRASARSGGGTESRE